MIRKPAAIVLASSVVVLACSLVPATFAAKGGNVAAGGKPSGGSSSLNLVVMDGATHAAHNGRVTFDVSTTATDRPFVGLRCWQGSAWVLDGYVGYFPGYMFPENWFVLDSPYWTDGLDATCTARLFYFDRRGNEKLLTTLAFSVAP